MNLTLGLDTVELYHCDSLWEYAARDISAVNSPSSHNRHLSCAVVGAVIGTVHGSVAECYDPRVAPSSGVGCNQILLQPRPLEVAVVSIGKVYFSGVTEKVD